MFVNDDGTPMDFPEVVAAVLVEEHGRTKEEATGLVKRFPDVLFSAMMAGSMMVGVDKEYRSVAIALERLEAEAKQVSATDPLPDESCSTYLDRMCGDPGTPERLACYPEVSSRYVTIWDNAWRERTARLRVDNIASYSLLASGEYRFQLHDGGICLCPKHLLPIAVGNYVLDCTYSPEL